MFIANNLARMIVLNVKPDDKKPQAYRIRLAPGLNNAVEQLEKQGCRGQDQEATLKALRSSKPFKNLLEKDAISTADKEADLKEASEISQKAKEENAAAKKAKKENEKKLAEEAAKAAEDK